MSQELLKTDGLLYLVLLAISMIPNADTFMEKMVLFGIASLLYLSRVYIKSKRK